MIRKFIVVSNISLLVLTLVASKGYSQSICIYLTDNQIYVNALDGGNITFFKNRKVAINEKVDQNFSYKHIDCEISLYHKGKLVNTLTHSAGYFDYKGSQIPEKYNCDCLIDSRKIVYTHLQKKNKLNLTDVSVGIPASARKD